MKNILKTFVCVVLAFSMIFCLAGCSSSSELTEENVTTTVDLAKKALMDFDKKSLDKYVESQTLDAILSFAKGHDQFVELGKGIFKDLEIEIDSIDLENKTVTISVKNKDLSGVASNFTSNLLSSYSTVQLLTKLSNDSFLDSSLSVLLSDINNVQYESSATVTLGIKQESKNLILTFDEDAENAVSGGALGAINSIIG